MRTKTAWRISLFALLVMSGPIWANDTTPRGDITVQSLRQREAQVEQLVKKVLPCTVCVRAANGGGSGSGVVVSEKGLVLTASHVMLAAGRDLIVVFPTGLEVKAKPLGANRNRDAGMVQILEEGPFEFAEVGKSASLETNQWCVSLGHAGGFDLRRSPPIRLGRVLNNGRFLTTDSALIGGDSGGPLFDLDGRVIGIHSNIGMTLSQNNHVPIDAFHDNWERMFQGETWGNLPGMRADPNGGVLGIQLSRAPNKSGVNIDKVVPNSPAEKAGLKTGDVVQQVNGRDVRSAQEAVDQLGRYKVGEDVLLKVLRGDKSLEISAKLIRRRDLPDPGPTPGKPDTKSDKEKKQKTPKGKDEDDEFDFEELLRQARRNGGQLRLTPEEAQKFQKRMREMQQQFRTRIVQPDPDPAQAKAIREWGRRVFAAYQPVVASVRKSVFPVLVKGKQVALATAVDEKWTVGNQSKRN